MSGSRVQSRSVTTRTSSSSRFTASPLRKVSRPVKLLRSTVEKVLLRSPLPVRVVL